MYNICATDMIYEQCAVDKEEVNMVMPYAVLHFVLSGEGVLNGKTVTRDTVFISFENQKMHYYPSRTDPWSYVYVRLKGPELKKAFDDYGFGQGVSVLPFHNVEPLLQLLALSRSLLARNSEEGGRIVAGALLLLFERKPSFTEDKSVPRRHVERIQRYIDENYYKRITVEMLSDIFYLNKNYIRTIFVRHLGLSPKQYLQKLRMERAAFLLTNTNEEIYLIAQSVGYVDALLFSKMFKRYYGVAPLQYRGDHRVSGAQRLSD